MITYGLMFYLLVNNVEIKYILVPQNRYIIKDILSIYVSCIKNHFYLKLKLKLLY